MKIIKLNKIILLLMLVLALGSCNDDESVQIYMPGNAVISATFDLQDTVSYTATIVGADYPTVSVSTGSDVTVNFKVDADKVASFNQSMGSSYTLLPPDNFTFDATGIIKKGEFSTLPLNLIIKDGDQLDAFSSYLLPISIDKVDGASVGNTQQTTYFILTRSPSLENLETFDRTAWTIAGMSTEEPGEGGGNGLASTALDGNYGTYWHTKWQGGEPAPPHYITIDMGEELVVHGVALVSRNLKDWAHGQPKSVKIAVSTDGVTFTDVGGTYPVEMGTDPVQKEIRFFLSSFKAARYLKVTVLSTWGATNSSSVAEIYAL